MKREIWSVLNAKLRIILENVQYSRVRFFKKSYYFILYATKLEFKFFSEFLLVGETGVNPLTGLTSSLAICQCPFSKYMYSFV